MQVKFNSFLAERKEKMQELGNELFEMSIQIIPMLVAMPEEKFNKIKLDMLQRTSDDTEIHNYMTVLFEVAEKRKAVQHG